MLWFSIPIPDGVTNRLRVRTKDNELFVAFASRSQRMQLGWLIRKGEYGRLRERPFGEVVNCIAAHVPAACGDTVRQTLKGWPDLYLLPVVSQIAER